MVQNGNTWFIRGGNKDNGGGAGIFNFNRTTGAANGSIGFRVTVVK